MWMTGAARPARYQIRIRGVLSDRLLRAFPDFQAETRGTDTVLTGLLPDQAALYGVLAEIEALGLHLLDVHYWVSKKQWPTRRSRARETPSRWSNTDRKGS
jgi:hypothetical protein